MSFLEIAAGIAITGIGVLAIAAGIAIIRESLK